jgi:hypothetical protein
MTWIIDTTSKCRLWARLGAGLAIAAILVLGTFAGSAMRVDIAAAMAADTIAPRPWFMARNMAGDIMAIPIFPHRWSMARHRYQSWGHRHRHSVDVTPIRKGNGRQRCRPLLTGQRTGASKSWSSSLRAEPSSAYRR